MGEWFAHLACHPKITGQVKVKIQLGPSVVFMRKNF